MRIKTANLGHMLSQEITIAEVLKEKGYVTGHFGKWHLGTLAKDSLDSNRGGKHKFAEDYSPPWENGFDVCFSTEAKVPTWDPMIVPKPVAGGVGKKPQGEFYGSRYWNEQGIPQTTNLEGDDSKVIMDHSIPFIEKSFKDNIPFLSVIWFHTLHTPVVAGEDYIHIFRIKPNIIMVVLRQWMKR